MTRLTFPSSLSRFNQVLSFLELQYDTALRSTVDAEDIMKQYDEKEAAKLCLLMLCCGVLLEKPVFMQAACKTEVVVQEHIKDM